MFKKIFSITALIISLFCILMASDGYSGFILWLISYPHFLITNFLFPFIINDIRVNDIYSKYYYIYNNPWLNIVATVLFWFFIGFLIDLLRNKFTKMKTS